MYIGINFSLKRWFRRKMEVGNDLMVLNCQEVINFGSILKVVWAVHSKCIDGVELNFFCTKFILYN